MAYIVIDAQYPTSIVCYLGGLDTNYSLSDRVIYWYVRGECIGTRTLDAYVSSGGTITASGLTANTTYYIQAHVTYNGGSSDFAEYGYTRPNYYYWTYSKSSGEAFNLTAGEWNGLTANINLVRGYRGLSDYSFAAAVSGNAFTAAIYNQAVYAIKGISGYGNYLSAVGSGAIIYASYLNTLISELNTIP